MALDSTVVIRVRQRFGDDESDDVGPETQAPFVGLQKDFDFQCPNVNRGEDAILLFQSQGVNIRQRLEINGQKIFGEIPPGIDVVVLPGLSPDSTPTLFNVARWTGNVMLVHSSVLQESNVLRIRAGEISDSGNVDNFIIDNVVVVFKTIRQPVLDPGNVAAL